MLCSFVFAATMPFRWLPPFIFLAALSLSRASAEKLSLSADGGETWRRLESPLAGASLPDYVRLRAGSDASRPTLYVPRCAVEDALRVAVVREKRGGAVLGLRWTAARGCGGEWKDGEKGGVVVREEVARRLKPDWAAYLRERVSEGGEEGQRDGSEEEKRKKKGFFGKYGLYIMGFVGFALARGIQKGMAELREEMEREEADKLKERKRTAQVKVVVPKRKQSAKTRRKAAVGASASGKQ